MTETRGHAFGTIQAARGVAATAVVLHHAGTLLSAPVFGGYTPMLGMFRFGHAGVDAIYLVHVPPMLACAVALAMAGLVGSAPAWAFMIGHAVITIALGSLNHVAIERPMLSLLRRSLLNRGAKSQGPRDADRSRVLP